MKVYTISIDYNSKVEELVFVYIPVFSWELNEFLWEEKNGYSKD